jgi:hypothetical protein
MKLKLVSTSVAALTLALAAPAYATPVVVNGSFEADTFGSAGTLGLGCGNTLTGWTTQCSPDGIYPWGLIYPNGYGGGPPPDGKQWVIVGDFGGDGSWIEQTLGGFIVGQTYNLNFELASENPGGPGSEVTVSFPSGSSAADQLFNAPLRGANFWDTWGSFSKSFVATATSVTFRMEGEPNASFDAGIDNVSITSAVAGVPEPATLALFGAALAGLGALRRRRKAKA